MPVEIGTANGHLDLLHRLQRFVCGHGTWSTAPQFTGAGPGTISDIATAPATVSETWTFTCSNADTAGEEVWAITGSVTGATADATTGIAYANGLIECLITGTGYEVGDEFSWDVTQGLMSAAGAAWTLLSEGLDGGFDQDYYFRAPGLTGSEEIYLNVAAYQSSADDYFNWEARGAIGHEPTFAFNGQPGTSPNANLLLWADAIPYWLVANGQRLILVAKISTTYQLLYLGKILPYGTPAQFPYPVLVAATTDRASTRWSAADADTSSILNPGRGAFLYTTDGGWKRIQNRYRSSSGAWETDFFDIFPTHQYGFGSRDGASHEFQGPQIHPAPDGSYTLLPLVPLCRNASYASLNQYGELDGLFWVTGTGNAAENILSIEGEDHLVVQNIYRTNWTEYGAMRLT
ncbi:hypothetical protein [Alcanivorax sp.]|uniref:hypothetical protein n=1 Tax=Alcanivorax sp. TaxID=1872427 RepID=UPI000C1029FD|nr:hypothetical protein [Alcanivorax sp.]PHR68507.1 MAG: hypothetical protein COA55_00370 [Alcanivorax sp.]